MEHTTSNMKIGILYDPVRDTRWRRNMTQTGREKNEMILEEFGVQKKNRIRP